MKDPKATRMEPAMTGDMRQMFELEGRGAPVT
jgi:hypothetical protein